MNIYLSFSSCEESSRDALVETSLRLGFTIVPYPWAADVIVVVSCACSRNKIRLSIADLKFLCIQKKQGATLISMGCLQKRVSPDYYKEFFPEVDKQCTSVDEVAKLLGEIIGECISWDPLECYSAGAFKELTIMYGCKNRCTFCKLSRGNYNFGSLPFDRLLKVARYYRSKGIKVICLHGLNCTQYGLDFANGIGLQHVIYALVDLGFEWINIYSVAPQDITQEILEALKLPQVCWIDLEFQTTWNPSLAAMKRNYTFEKYLGIAKEILASNPNAILHTNVLACHPYEAEEEVAQNIRFIKSCSNRFIFTLSEYYEAYSTSSKLPPLDPFIYAHRRKKYHAAIYNKDVSFYLSLKERSIQVICSQKTEAHWICLHPFDHNGQVHIPIEKTIGEFVPGKKILAKITSIEAGEIVDGIDAFMEGEMISGIIY